jgi:hypothetical protein
LFLNEYKMEWLIAIAAYIDIVVTSIPLFGYLSNFEFFF